MTDHSQSPSEQPSPDLPAQLSAADIRALALQNLAARARTGKPLTDADWQRLHEIERAEQPDVLGDALAALQAEVEAMRAAKKRPPAALLKLTREALLRDLEQHVWPDVPAAAKELGKSVQTIRNWCEELGIAHQRQPIPKAELYRGLWLRAKDQAAEGAAGGQSDADAREQELRMLERQARIDERTGRLTDIANDNATAGLIAATRDLRQALENRLPALLADDLAIDCDRVVWEGQCHRSIRAHLHTITTDILNTDTSPENAS